MFNWLKTKLKPEPDEPIIVTDEDEAQPVNGHWEIRTEDDPRGVKTHFLHGVLGYGIWAILCVVGGILLIVMTAEVMGGFSAAFVGVGVLLTGFAAWFPTHCAARGRTFTFRLLCLLLDLVACVGTAFVLATTGQMLIEREARTGHLEQAQKGATTISQACTRQPNETQRAFNRRCVSVNKTLGAALESDRQANDIELVKIPFLLEARPYVRYLELLLALIIFAGMAILWICFAKWEDVDGDGVLDALQSKKKIQKRVWVPATSSPKA